MLLSKIIVTINKDEISWLNKIFSKFAELSYINSNLFNVMLAEDGSMSFFNSLLSLTYFNMNHEKIKPIGHIIRFISKRTCYLQVDKVYSILSLINAKSFKVDYNLTKDDAFIKLIKQLYENGDNSWFGCLGNSKQYGSAIPIFDDEFDISWISDETPKIKWINNFNIEIKVINYIKIIITSLENIKEYDRKNSLKMIFTGKLEIIAKNLKNEDMQTAISSMKTLFKLPIITSLCLLESNNYVLIQGIAKNNDICYDINIKGIAGQNVMIILRYYKEEYWHKIVWTFGNIMDKNSEKEQLINIGNP